MYYVVWPDSLILHKRTHQTIKNDEDDDDDMVFVQIEWHKWQRKRFQLIVLVSASSLPFIFDLGWCMRRSCKSLNLLQMNELIVSRTNPIIISLSLSISVLCHLNSQLQIQINRRNKMGNFRYCVHFNTFNTLNLYLVRNFYADLKPKKNFMISGKVSMSSENETNDLSFHRNHKSDTQNTTYSVRVTLVYSDVWRATTKPEKNLSKCGQKQQTA